MKSWLQRYGLSGGDVALTVLVLVGMAGVVALNSWIAFQKSGGKDALRLQIVATRPLFPGATIGEDDVAVRLRPETDGFSDASEVVGRRTAEFIEFDTPLTKDALDRVASVSGSTTFVVKMKPTYSMNAAPGTWITLVRSGKSPPMPIGLFHVCSRAPVANDVDEVTLEACQMADAIAILSQASQGDWIPIPLSTKYSCANSQQGTGKRVQSS